MLGAKHWKLVSQAIKRPSAKWIVRIIAGLVGYSSLPTLILLFKSSEQHPRSIRTRELEEIRSCPWGDQNYAVVIGPKGVGKSCLVNTFVSRTRGVVECRVPPGIDEETIVNNALRAITKMSCGDYFFLQYRALWVIYLFKWLSFGKSPLLVVRASERTEFGKKPCAELTGAVRYLTENYGLHVIVDGSPNAIDPSLLQTRRQRVINIEPYDQSQLWSIPEFQVLFADLEAVGLKSAVWSVLGGYPDLYETVRTEYSALTKRDRDGKLTEAGKKTLHDIVWKTVEDQIYEAIKTVDTAIVQHHQMETILKLLQETTLKMPSALLVRKKLVRPNPDKVLREMRQDGERFLVPANQAIGLVIRHNLAKVPPREKLAELLK